MIFGIVGFIASVMPAIEAIGAACAMQIVQVLHAAITKRKRWGRAC
jgi:hypothetical protein